MHQIVVVAAMTMSGKKIMPHWEEEVVEVRLFARVTWQTCKGIAMHVTVVKAPNTDRITFVVAIYHTRPIIWRRNMGMK